MKPTTTRGTRDALIHPALLDETALDNLRDNEFEVVRKLAGEHNRDAIDTLVTLMMGRKTPATVKRACARDLIEIAHGRIGGPGQAVQGGGGGLKIIINNLSGGTSDVREMKAVEVEYVKNVAAIVEDLEEADTVSAFMEPVVLSSGVGAAGSRQPDWRP